MTSARNDGGPAFPQQCADALDVGMVHAGMSLRDYFAGQALAGIYASQYFVDHVNAYGSSASGPDGCQAGAARLAFATADAMLAARDAEPQP